MALHGIRTEKKIVEDKMKTKIGRMVSHDFICMAAIWKWIKKKKK